MARPGIRSILEGLDFGRYVRSLPEVAALPFAAAPTITIVEEAPTGLADGFKFSVRFNGATIASTGELGNPYGWYARAAIRRAAKRAAKVIAKIESSKSRELVIT